MNHHNIIIVVCSMHLFFGASSLQTQPTISIITSMYNADQFIEGFLQDIVEQTIFDQCELILINANSPGQEEEKIANYLCAYPNIRSIKLSYDPGLYAVWNMAIKLARGEYITNANCDDRHNPRCFEFFLDCLQQNPDIDLVYADYLMTYTPNETFANNHYRWLVQPIDFAPEHMYLCLPGPQPMWRASVHQKYGYFDEIFTSSGDWEFWLRAVAGGAQFKKVPIISGLFYCNPEGISTTEDTTRQKLRDQENTYIIHKYQHLWSKNY